MKDSKSVHIVVVGGGYAGINLIENLKSCQGVKITLINEGFYHLHQTDIHKFISGHIPIDEVCFDLRQYSKKVGINFVKGKVQKAQFDKKYIILGNKEQLEYDYLVIATGSKSFFPKQIKNIENYAKDIKIPSVLQEEKKKFEALLKDKKKGKNIAIVGGGLSGVEIALEFSHKLKKEGIDSDECTISLIEQLDDVLPNMDPYLVNKTRNACDELDIKRYHGAFVKEVKDNKIYLSNSNEIPFDMILFVIGVSSEKLATNDDVEINIKNQFVVDDYLRIKNHKDVFVVGDVAQVIDKKGNYVLPTAQIAVLQAKVTATNIKNLLKNKPLIKNNTKTRGVMIDLGSKDCIGIILGLKVSGFIAYFLKRFVSKKHIKIFR